MLNSVDIDFKNPEQFEVFGAVFSENNISSFFNILLAFNI